MPINLGCSTCDYYDACNRTITVTRQDGEQIKVPAKTQNQIRMKCDSQVQHICRSCQLFAQQRCASWKIVNGKEKTRGILRDCPTRVPTN